MPGDAQGAPKEAFGGSICVLNGLWGVSGATLVPSLLLFGILLVHFSSFLCSFPLVSRALVSPGTYQRIRRKFLSRRSGSMFARMVVRLLGKLFGEYLAECSAQCSEACSREKAREIAWRMLREYFGKCSGDSVEENHWNMSQRSIPHRVAMVPRCRLQCGSYDMNHLTFIIRIIRCGSEHLGWIV